MAKNKTSLPSKFGKICSFLFKTIELFVLLSIIGLAVFLWQKPQYLTQWLKISDNQLSSINSAKIETIENKLETLNLITQNSAEKSDLLQQNFNTFAKSKADNEQIITLTNQINDLRNSTKKLSQTSNSGALLLTSAMLIRDNIYKGIGCKNEAEGLKILAKNIDNISQDVEFISNHCNTGFVSNNTLINNFNDIYNQTEKKLQPKDEQNWKQRLSTKLGEYVQISNRNQPQQEPYDPIKILSPIKQLVNGGDFSAALNELSKPQNQNLMSDENLQNWYEQTKNQLDFYKSLSNIINASLLIMKVEDAQNVTE